MSAQNTLNQLWQWLQRVRRGEPEVYEYANRSVRVDRIRDEAMFALLRDHLRIIAISEAETCVQTSGSESTVVTTGFLERDANRELNVALLPPAWFVLVREFRRRGYGNARMDLMKQEAKMLRQHVEMKLVRKVINQ